MKKIKPMTVERCDLGYWTHPDYFEPANNNEYGFLGEFEAWLADQGLEHSVISLECDDAAEELAERYADGDLDCDISAWDPSRPDGEGWFIGSIHDTEDGPYCIWLRSKGDTHDQ